MTAPIQQQLFNARKNQILNPAAAVFAEKGFQPTTIHNYFGNKSTLLLGIFDRMRETYPFP